MCPDQNLSDSVNYIEYAKIAISVLNTLIISAGVYVAYVVWKNNRKADIYLRMREYYINYLDDVIKNDDLDIFDLSNDRLSLINKTQNGDHQESRTKPIEKKEIAILYKIPPMIERHIDYCLEFNQPPRLDEWKPWMIGWFRRSNFKIMWQEMHNTFPSDSIFMNFMDECQKEALFQEQKKGLNPLHGT